MRVRVTKNAPSGGYTRGKIYDVVDDEIIDDAGHTRQIFLNVQDPWHVVVDEDETKDVDWSKVKGTTEWKEAQEADDEPVASIPQPEFVDAVDFINKAAEYVGGSRAKTHGDKGTNFRTTAALHEGLDNAQEIADHALDPALQFALQMILAKMSRIVSGAYNPDDYVDIAGYAGCAGEIAAQLDADGS